jgi:uncharacterized protein YjbI with pentapeptide repeats
MDRNMEVSKTYLKVVGLGLFFLAAVFLFLNVYFFSYGKDFWQNLMVELHGALFDALLFTLLFHFILSRSLRAKANEQATSTLDKLRNRFTLKVASKEELFDAIKILQNEMNTISDIHFNHDLSGITLTGGVFVNCFFEKQSDLSGAEFTSCTFRNCEIMVDLAQIRDVRPSFDRNKQHP